jgi:hypothetical protein
MGNIETMMKFNSCKYYHFFRVTWYKYGGCYVPVLLSPVLWDKYMLILVCLNK